MSHTSSTRWTRRGLLLAGAALLSACGGIPLSSLPKLARLSDQMLEVNPAQFMVAVQLDARLVPPPGAVPLLILQVKPKVEGAFEPVDRKLPLALTTYPGATMGLDAPGPGRRWMVYSLPPATQAELARVQALVRQAQAQPGYQRGGTMSIGVEQKDLLPADTALDQTRWSTWIQVKSAEGFFEVWDSTPAQLRKAAADAAAKAAQR